MEELLEENEVAGMIYNLVKRQVLTINSGEHDKVIDLDYVALIEVMKLHKVKNPLECFEKVIHTFHYFLELKDGPG